MGFVLQVARKKTLMPKYVFSKGKIEVQDGIYSPVRDKAKRFTGAGVLILCSALVTCTSKSDHGLAQGDSKDDQRQK